MENVKVIFFAKRRGQSIIHQSTKKKEYHIIHQINLSSNIIMISLTLKLPLIRFKSSFNLPPYLPTTHRTFFLTLKNP